MAKTTNSLLFKTPLELTKNVPCWSFRPASELTIKFEFKALLGQPMIAVMGSEQARYTADLLMTHGCPLRAAN